MLKPSRVLTLWLSVFLVTSAIWTTRNNYTAKYASIVLFLFLFGAVIFWSRQKTRFFLIILVALVLPWIIFNNYSMKNSPMASGNFTIIEEPKVIGRYQYILLRDGQSFGTNVTLKTNQFPKFEIGNVLQVEGKFVPASDDTKTSWEKYKRITGEYIYPNVRLISNEPTRGIYRLQRRAAKVKHSLESNIFSSIPEPQSSLLNGIIFGSKSQLSSEIVSILTIVGVVHIIALSGYNITIINDYAKRIFSPFGRVFTVTLTLVFIITFVFATGLSSSVIRAAIMGVLLMAASFFGRQSDSPNAILLAASAMVIFNPYIVLYDIGFQLSFLAVIGIIFIAPKLSDYLNGLNQHVAAAISATLAAQIMTWPLLSFYFGRISVVSLITNILVLPIIPLVMSLGFATALAGFINHLLSKIFSLTSWFLLSYIINISSLLSRIPVAQINWKISSPWFLAGYYLLILEVILYINVKKGTGIGALSTK